MVSKFIKMGFELPKSKSQWVIAVCCIIYVVLELYLNEFFDVDLLTASDRALFRFWLLRVIRDVSLAIALSGILILGIRSLRRDGFTIKRFVLPAVAVLLCLFFTGISIFGHISTSRIQRILFDINDSYKEHLREWLDVKDLSLTKRSEISLKYAIEVWKESGEAIKYISNDGKEIVYEPSLKEIEESKKMDKANQLIVRGLKGMKRAYIFWPIVALASVAIGFFTPIRRKNQVTESNQST